MKSFLIRGATLTIFIVALLIILPNYVQAATITVEAFIDGKSQLIIRGNTAQWHHLEWTAPGIPDVPAENYPTTINSANWTPLWSLPTLDCNCYSDVFSGVSPALPLVTQIVTLTRVQARDGVPSVTIIQQPSTANDYKLIVEFNDITGGAAWYIIQLDFPDQGDCNCYDIIATDENSTANIDYWAVCLDNGGTGILYSENADTNYNLYLFGGGPGWFNTSGSPAIGGNPGWSTWIARGANESGFLQPIGDGYLLTGVGVRTGNTRYTVQGKKIPCTMEQQ
jgi:hypothetical protein